MVARRAERRCTRCSVSDYLLGWGMVGGKGKVNGSGIGRYPVIDLFAGPGGLGEGFAAAVDGDGRARFHSAAAIERDDHAHQTLLLRHFFRHFPEGDAPPEYYDFLDDRISRDELFAAYPVAYQEAQRSALKISLGPATHSKVRKVVEQQLAGANLWALVGGPPCQAYSLAGRSRMMRRPGFAQDERHTLYLEYLRIIIDHRPPIFVMENVKGLLSATIEGRSAISRIARDLASPVSAVDGGPADLSYKLYSLSHEGAAEGEIDPRLFVVRAEEHGIPQARHRMFIVGVRSDINVRPRVLQKLKPPTVRDTIGTLPAIRSGLSRSHDTFEAWWNEVGQTSAVLGELNGSAPAWLSEAFNADSISGVEPPRGRSSKRYDQCKLEHVVLANLQDPRLNVLTLHDARGHMASDLRRYHFAATFARETGKSPKLADFPAPLLPAHQNVEMGRSGKMFSDRFRVQVADQVSTTITSHISKDGHYFIHYDPAQCRSLTVREAARLQTFPDNYFFCGPRTAQYHQVGNAVPPQLAVQIADIVADLLDSLRKPN